MKHFLLFLCVLVPSFSLAAPGKTPITVPIGLASNFSETSTSNSNPFGNYFRDGVTLAVEEAEFRLTKAGIKLQLEQFDYGNTQVRVLDAAKKAAESDVIAVLGYNFSSHALLAAPVHQQAKLPMLTPSATAERVGTFGKYIHQGCFGGQLMGETLASVAIHRLKSKKVAIIAAADCAYCQSLADSFTHAFEGSGRKTQKFLILENDRDFAKEAASIKEGDFDAVLIPNQELTSARIISALLKGGVKVPFLGGDGWGNVGTEFFQILAGQDFQGYSLSHWHPDLKSQSTKTFVAAYTKRFGKSPNDTSVLAYDSMNLLIEVIMNAKAFTREGIEKSFEDTKKFSGVTGKFYFGHAGPPRKDLVLLAANGSKFKILQVIQPGGEPKEVLTGGGK